MGNITSSTAAAVQKVLVIEDGARVKLTAFGLASGNEIGLLSYPEAPGVQAKEGGVDKLLSFDDNPRFINGPGKWLIDKPATFTASIHAEFELNSHVTILDI